MDLTPRVFRSLCSSAELAARKDEMQLTISVCLPALNEEATIGRICSSIRPLMPELVDELIVMDSGSTDRTLEVASAAGAAPFSAASVLEDISIRDGGKGEALWKSLAVAKGDIVVWLDSDTKNFEPSFVLDLIEPLLADERIRFSKAFYERPLLDPSGAPTLQGARVTELVARPLSHLLFPELTGFIQPLSGECASYRKLLYTLPFITGYGVDIGLLIDLIQTVEMDRIVQVDLGSRIHRNQEILALGRMAFHVTQAMTMRAEQLGRLKLANDWPETMLQFVSGPEGPVGEEHRLGVTELPPMESVSSSD